MATIPEKYNDLFEKPALGSLATLMADGSPQVTPVWLDREGEYIRVNTAKGRVKDRNMRRDGRVALAIIDPADPYRYVEIRGRVASVSEDGAEAHIDKLAKKYIGADVYPWRKPDEVRVIFRILPEHVSGI